ncbi:MAG: SEC-C metal-binding domain-containing protein [Gammaproteobacteria bacterium]
MPSFFEPSSKRKRGFPSETRVKRGNRVVHGEKDLVEKLGRNDPCPCGSKRRFQGLLPEDRQVRRRPSESLFQRMSRQPHNRYSSQARLSGPLETGAGGQ